jgi:NRAMP (natural resistance-associated macrophage protein)-like metal ion transporter
MRGNNKTTLAATTILTGRTGRRWFRRLGPGLITGAADDDPSGIATYSQAGAQFGYQLGWTVVLTLPLMVAVQLISARIGRVTGKGLAANIREHFPVPVLYAIVIMLLVANTINIAADIAAMGESVRLVVGGSSHVYAVLVGVTCLMLEVFLTYRQYVRYLKWLTVALFSYVAVVFAIDVPWLKVLTESIWPRLAMSSGMLTVVVAVLGTTISPYLFFWQAAQEVEEMKSSSVARALKKRPAHSRWHLDRITIDTVTGMTLSNLIAFFIIVATAATLNRAGVTNIQSSAQAAEALRPLAGEFASLLFSMGIVGTGLLAVPVLAGSAAYAVAESFRWKGGLDLQPRQAKGFYAIVAVATLGGVALNFTRIDPIQALFWTAVINGVIAVPIMAVMMTLAGKRRVMGTFIVNRGVKLLGWAATAIMAVAVAAMLLV